MAWFGDGLSNLKGQITNFTKEVLSDAIIQDTDEKAGQIDETSDRYADLQRLLDSKDAEISLLKRQNYELQNAKSRQSTNEPKRLDDEGGGDFSWDPPPAKSRSDVDKNQRKLSIDAPETTVTKVRGFEAQSNDSRDASTHGNFELLRAKNDTMNHIVHIGEKDSDGRRRKNSFDESALINDFRDAILKLDSHEKSYMIKAALKALDDDNVENEAGSGFETVSLVSRSDDLTVRNGLVTEGTEAMSLEMDKLRRKIEELQKENEFLTTSLDELDKEHAQSLDTVLMMKNQLSKKHESLQKAYEALYVECNEAKTKLEFLETQLPPEKNNNKRENNRAEETNDMEKLEWKKRETSEVSVQADSDDNTDEMSLEKEKNARFADYLSNSVKSILGNCHVATKENESLFEALAREFVDIGWKKDTLERKLKEIGRELEEACDSRDSLQLECDDMQTSMESLVGQIEDLKSKLPSIPEASEERVASLECETESMSEEIKALTNAHEALKKKHFELLTAMSVLEGTLRNQENLEAEVRNAKEELELSRQRLDNIGAWKDSENHENMIEDASRRLRASLEENSQLRKRIEDLLEMSRNYEIREAEGKIREDGNLVRAEKMSKKMTELEAELEVSKARSEELEKSLALVTELKSELERDVNAVCTEKEHLEAEIAILRENSLENEKASDSLNRLRGQLESANREKNDLEYDILNMRKELDSALVSVEALRGQLENVVRENDRLAKENDDLMEQSTGSNDEASERIQLLQTELNLINAEGRACDQIEISKLRAEVANLENDRVNMSYSQQGEMEKIARLEAEIDRLKSDLEMERQASVEKSQKLEMELSRLCDLENQLETTQKRSAAMCRELEARFEKERMENAKVGMERENIIDSQLEKMARLEAEIDSLKSDLEKERRASVEKCQKLEMELSRLCDLENQLKTTEERSATIDNEKRSLEDRCRELEAKFEEKMIENGNLLRKMSELMEKIGMLESQIDRSKLATIDNEKIALLEGRCRELEDERAKSTQNQSTTRETEMAELMEKIGKLESLLSASMESGQMAKETIENLSQLVKSKDTEILELSRSTKEKEEMDKNAIAQLQSERDEFVRLIQEKHNANLKYYAEIQRMGSLVMENSSSLQQTIGDRDRANAKLQEKEAELEVVRQRLKSLEESHKDTADCSMRLAQASMLQEKCKALEAALVQEQANYRILQGQLAEAQSRESLNLKELERLRAHLIDIEENHTEELVAGEEQRKQLTAKLHQAEEKVQTSSTVYTSASIRANQQVETLQQQIGLLVQQRDDIQTKLSIAEDKLDSHTASLTNLQIVLEQFQRDKENDIRTATEKIRQQLNTSYKEQEDLRNEIASLRAQLSEAKECLQAASRLSEQLDKKSSRISELNEQVAKLTELVDTADQRIQEALLNGESKVDRNLVKNLLVGFLTASTVDKSSVLRVFATVLELDEAEKEKIGLNHATANNGWFSGLLGSSAPKDQEASLSAAFVRFLESESKPKPQLPALTISNSSLSRPGHSRQHSSSSTQSGLLLSNITLPSFPDFVPSRNTGSILKEVLKDS